MKVLTALLVVSLMAGCSFRRGPISEEQLKAEEAAAAVRGRALVEQAVSAAPNLVYTINYGNARAVAKNFVLEQNRFCYDQLATRGVSHHDDYWTNFDRYTDGVKRTCSYYFVKSVRLGDDRE